MKKKIDKFEPRKFGFNFSSCERPGYQDHKLNMIAKVLAEYERASRLHAPFNSAHEGYAIIKEEVDEMWDCIKENEVDHARREAMQIGAMALRFLIDIKPDPKSP